MWLCDREYNKGLVGGWGAFDIGTDVHTVTTTAYHVPHAPGRPDSSWLTSFPGSPISYWSLGATDVALWSIWVHYLELGGYKISVFAIRPAFWRQLLSLTMSHRRERHQRPMDTHKDRYDDHHSRSTGKTHETWYTSCLDANTILHS